MDVSGSSTADGAAVQQWTDNGSDAQKWVLTKVN
ncbi:RICIN domain-containing protein [Paenibacillus sonchi]